MRTRKVFADYRLPEDMRSRLRNLGLEVTDVFPNARMSESVASHPDMNILTFAGKRFTVQETFVRKDRGDVLTAQGSDMRNYPKDAALNAVCIGNDFVCCEKSVDRAVLDYAVSRGMHIIAVRQGYVKCNLIVVSEDQKAVITEDVGIAETLKKENYDVLKLTSHTVQLAPFAYGFIGGASGVFGNLITFTGNIRLHSEYDKIRFFCGRYKKEIVSLSDKPLYDYGSLLPDDEISH